MNIANMVRLIVLVFLLNMAWIALTNKDCKCATMKIWEGQIDDQLIELKPLPKIHYSFGVHPQLIDEGTNPHLFHYIRIARAISVDGAHVTAKQIGNCVLACREVNRIAGGVPASMAAVFSPWHYRFKKGLPPMDRGNEYHAELNFIQSRLEFIKKHLGFYNKTYRSSIRLSAILLDCERFREVAGDRKWNQAMREKLDIIHKMALSAFPKARIEWYGRGVSRVWRGNGWDKTAYFTGKEVLPSLSCSLYSLPEIERTRETFRRTCQLADNLGVWAVTPWVALGAGYRRGVKKAQFFDRDWQYDVVYAYLIGAELNMKWYGDREERFAPYNRAEVVVFYPPPFSRKTPAWGKFFVAYVRGATGVKNLDDLGFSEP